MSIWWSSACVAHCNFLKTRPSIMAEIFCDQLDKMMLKLREKHPRLVNRPTPILSQDKGRPHTAYMTVPTLQELELELTHHPPHSPGVALTDYHLFCNLDNLFIAKNFKPDNAVKPAFQEFIDSHPPEFYTTSLNNLPFKWQKCVDNMGTCIDE